MRLLVALIVSAPWCLASFYAVSHLNVRMPEQQGVDFRIEYPDGLTGVQAAARVAARINVHPAFVVLFKNNVVATGEALSGVAGVQTLTDRDLSLRVDNSRLTLEQHRILPGDTLTAMLRPLRGDHLHNAMAIYYKGKLVQVPSDRPVLAVGNNLRHNESGDTCGPDRTGGQHRSGSTAAPEAGSAAYIGERPWEGNHVNNVYPHFGVHSGADQWFGMGLIHVHPATSWQWFRHTEGLGCNLGAFLEQVGIWVWEPESHRYPFHTPTSRAKRGEVIVDFPVGTMLADGTPLRSNHASWSHCDYPTRRILVQNGVDVDPTALDGGADAEYEWVLSYWPHYNASDADVNQLRARLDRVWLHHNQAMLTLSYQKKDTVRPLRPPQRSIDYLANAVTAFHSEWPRMFGDDSERHAGDKIPHDVSGISVLGFDGHAYPMPNLPPRSGKDGSKAWEPALPDTEREGGARFGQSSGQSGAHGWGVTGASGIGGKGGGSSISVEQAIGIAIGVAAAAAAGTFLAMRTSRTSRQDGTSATAPSTNLGGASTVVAYSEEQTSLVGEQVH